ncbi:MAG TPA: hypothetical protein PKJ33_00655 [Alphaproteobacteria bacterium]|nr:hypothetical protein [Alphaproteobacteria bacterium]
MAEIAWLPGVSNKKALELIKSLNGAIIEQDAISSLPALAGLNVVTTMLSIMQKAVIPQKNVSDILYKMAVDFESIDTEKLIRILNEDRAVAGISEITDIAAVDSDLHEHKLTCVKTIQAFLQNYTQKQITATMLSLVNKAVKNGQKLSLIDSFIDNLYAMEVQKGLQKLEDSIEASRQKIKTGLSKKNRSKTYMTGLVDEFLKELENFDEIMQPIQVSMQQRGLEHEETKHVADEARECAIDLVRADEMELSEKVLYKVKELFSELGSVDDRSIRDLNDLENIKNQNRQHAKDITCKIEQNGFWSNHSFEISANGIKVDGELICKLENINAIRYGITRKSTNGVYSGTDTLLAFSTSENETIINWLDHSSNWTKAADCLWKAVGPRLVFAMANELARGGNIYEIIYDNKVKLAKTNTWTPVEEKFFKWSEVKTMVVQGQFIIAAKDGSGFMATLSLQDIDNVHVAEALINVFFNTGGTNISQAFGITKEAAKKEKRIKLSTPVSLVNYSFLWSWFWVVFIGVFLIVWAANS